MTGAVIYKAVGFVKHSGTPSGVVRDNFMYLKSRKLCGSVRGGKPAEGNCNKEAEVVFILA